MFPPKLNPFPPRKFRTGKDEPWSDSESLSFAQSDEDSDSSASLSMSTIQMSDEDSNAEEDNDNKRANKVKTAKQNASLLQLYIHRDKWTKSFMDKAAIKLHLKPVQVYKWRWDRSQAEGRIRQRLRLMPKLPEKVFYITKVNRKTFKKRSIVSL